MSNPTWTSRDLPVLDAVVTLLDQGIDGVRIRQIVELTGLDTKSVQVALTALSEPPTSYLRLPSNQNFGDSIDFVFGVTHEARRVVGSWPTAETLADALIDRLHLLSDDENAETEVRDRAKAGLRAFMGAGRDVLVGVVGSTISAGIIGA